ncbi:MAG: cytochrome c peroxidase [Mariprofundaceae bacterium]|nr:cytochrome c peroxidase [Mariprofundaceae bacterium]
MQLLFLIACLWIFSHEVYAAATIADADKWIQTDLSSTTISSNSLDQHELGRLLFFDPRLSNQVRSCATCHHPGLGWADASAHPMGSKNALQRHTPTLVNIAFAKRFFWDGRGTTLEKSIAEHITSLNVIHGEKHDVIQNIRHLQQYREQFKEIFAKQDIDLQQISAAIATFIRSISSGSTPFDRWIAGDSSAISNNAKRGFHLFTHKARCHHCHNSPNFSDNKFHYIGLNSIDPGRFEITKKDTDMNAFKTPNLRHIAVTAPYMHDGSKPDLKSVIEFYNRGGDQQNAHNKLIPLLLSDTEKNDLLHFLYSLTGENTEVIVPTLPTNIQIPRQLLNPSFKNVL